MAIKSGSKKDKAMEKKFGVKPGSAADRKMEKTGKAPTDKNDFPFDKRPAKKAGATKKRGGK